MTIDRNIIFPRAIRYLLAVAEHHSFTKAAEALFVSQPTLSQQIKHLEETLDVQLLDRSGRAVRLTDAGEVYLSHARRALGELEAGKRAIHELQDLSRGSIRLGMTPITEYLATPLLNEFKVNCPGIGVSTVEMSQDDIEVALAEDQIDIGIAFTNMLSTETRSGEIDTQILFIESLNLAVGKSHYLAGVEAPQDKSVLEREPLALLNTNFALRRHIDLYCMEHEVDPDIEIETNSLSVILEIVRLGRFATILPNAIACAQHDLFPVTLLPELPNHTITMICHKGAYKSPACIAFAEVAAQWCANGCQLNPSKRLRPCPLSDVCEIKEKCD